MLEMMNSLIVPKISTMSELKASSDGAANAAEWEFGDPDENTKYEPIEINKMAFLPHNKQTEEELLKLQEIVRLEASPC